VTDSENQTVTSDPLTITVQASAGLVIDPDPTRTFAFSDEQDENGNYIFRSGEPVFFRVGVSGGTPPYQYQWDFNNDGTIDSTVSNPQYIFTNNNIGIDTFVTQLRVVDTRGAEAFYSFTIPVEGRPIPPGELRDFVVLLTSSPVQNNGVITLRYDPTGATGGVPTEPELELTAAVSSNPNEQGRPPYEFYWDFENDGKIDIQSQSPTLPFFDPIRKITVNPYLHNQDEKSFTLRLLAIDSAGNKVTVLRTIRVINMANRPADTLGVDIAYGFAGQPYIRVNNNNEFVTATFNIEARGSTGFYDFQIDVDGDGTGDVPTGGGFTAITGNTASQTVTFGDDGDVNTVDRPTPQYYAARVIVRSLSQAGGSQQDIVTTETPLSIVELGINEGDIDADPSTPAVDGTLPRVMDHTMVGFGTTSAGGANGQSLDSRGVLIAGGARGTTALRDVFSLTQTFNDASAEGQGETSIGVVLAEHTPMNIPRRGAVAFVNTDPEDPNTDPDSLIYVYSGRNPVDGALSSGEFHQVFNPGGQWVVSTDELRVGGQRHPVYDMGAYPVILSFGQPAEAHWTGIFTGGLVQQNLNENATVSGPTFFYDAGVITGAPDDPSDDLFRNIGASLQSPRYELSLVLSGSALYAIGGRISTGQTVSSVEKFDFATGGPWIEVANLQDPRSGASADVIDDKIYIYGGGYYASDGSQRTLVTTAEVYNPETETWSYTVPLQDEDSGALRATYDGRAVRLPGPGSIDAGDQTFNSIWYFGGEGQVGVNTSETNFLQEFIYFRNDLSATP
jgi:hypothetical protein